MVAIRPGIAGLLGVAGVLLAPTVGSPAPSSPEPCKNVAEAILEASSRLKSPGALSRLAPYMSPDSVPVLERRLGNPGGRSMGLWVALGRTQHASALLAVRGLRASQQLEDRVGHALSLLALGEGAETGTITLALSSAPEALRERVATELAQLWGARPRDLLYPVLEDPSPAVRFVAARHLSSWSTRARRTLHELADGSDQRFRGLALEALVERGQRLPLDRVQRLSASHRTRALMKEASRGNSIALRELRSDLRSSEEPTRVGAMGALAALGAETSESLRRITQKARPAGDYEPELSMARLLLGETSALSSVSEADPAGVARAVEVLWLFTHSKLKTATADPATTASFLPVAERWLLSVRLSEPRAMQLLQAVEVLDPELSLRLSRQRIRGSDGESFEVASHVLGRGGGTGDIPSLVAAAKRVEGEDSKSAALVAAARICAR